MVSFYFNMRKDIKSTEVIQCFNVLLTEVLDKPFIETETEKKCPIVDSTVLDCDISQVSKVYQTLTNEQLIELKEILEFQLCSLNGEIRSNENFEDITTNDLEVEREMVLYKLEEVEKCLIPRYMSRVHEVVSQGKISMEECDMEEGMTLEENEQSCEENDNGEIPLF